MNRILASTLALVLVSACGRVADDAGASAAPGAGVASPGTVPPIESPCDLSQASSRAVLAATVGAYGGKQDVYFLRADGTFVLGRSFGAERTKDGAYIYIGDAEVARHGDYLFASRGSDGASVFDLAGTSVFEAMTIEAATAFLSSRGVAIEEEAQRITMETSAEGAPVVVLRRAEEVIRLPLPDYRGEPNVNVEAVRGEWAVVGSYTADRSWRVSLTTAEIVPLSKTIPPALQQFGAYQVGVARLYFGLANDGGFLATLRDSYSGSVYHSPDGVTGWTRLGSAARDVKHVAARAMASGTYVIAGYTTGPETSPWADPPAGYGPVVSGAFDELVRPSTGARHPVPHGVAVDLTDDGRCAAYLAPSNDGTRTISILDVESGALATPSIPADGSSTRGGAKVQWIR